MRHPLTSKERRGLVAIAAAALLCISAGFIVRNCGGVSAPSPASGTSPSIEVSDSLSSSEDSDRAGKAERPKKSKEATKRRASKKKKARQEKTYPVRDPLSQPCD